MVDSGHDEPLSEATVYTSVRRSSSVLVLVLWGSTEPGCKGGDAGADYGNKALG